MQIDLCNCDAQDWLLSPLLIEILYLQRKHFCNFVSNLINICYIRWFTRIQLDLVRAPVSPQIKRRNSEYCLRLHLESGWLIVKNISFGLINIEKKICLEISLGIMFYNELIVCHVNLPLCLKTSLLKWSIRVTLCQNQQ